MQDIHADRILILARTTPIEEVKKKTEGVVESFEKMDGEARVSRERNRR